MRTTTYRILAGVLLLAAALKAYALASGQSVPDGWSNDPRLRLLAIEWEVLLGVWLLAGRVGPAGWAAALLTFAGFAGLNGVLGWTGATSCGCLGAVHVNPWWMFGLDAAAVALLVRLRPSWSEFGWRRVGLLVPAALAVGFAALAVAGSSGERYGEEPRAKVRGDEVVVRPREVSVGTGRPGEWREAVVELVNWTPGPVRVYGGTTQCKYDILVDCPAVVGAGTAASLRVRLRLPEAAGLVRQDAAFWVSNEAGTTAWDIPVTLTGTASGEPD